MAGREHARAEKFYSIGEVYKITGVKPNILRYWEQEFKELKPIRRRKGSHRLYGDRDIDTVRSIRHLLKEEGLSIAGARRRLAESPQEELPFTSMGSGAREVLAELKQELSELEALLSGD